MKKIWTIILLQVLTAVALAAEPKSVQMVKSELIRNPEPRTIDYNVVWKWNYTHGLLLQSMLQTAAKHPEIEASVDQYVKVYLDSIIQKDGTIKYYNKTNYTLDHINPGKMLIMAYEKYKEPRFKIALDTLYSQLQSHPRVPEGGFWHKKSYPNQMWLDGIYMGAPFYCEYALRYLKGEEQQKAFDDVVQQIMIIARHTFDKDCGLYRHAWDSAKKQQWANPETGMASHVWGRALGWCCMAMVDVLGLLPQDHPGKDSILSVLVPLCKNIKGLQDKDYGAWYQVMDEGQRTGNYLETSCTAMFAYTFVKGAKNGWLPEEFLKYGKTAYDGLNKFFVRHNPDGTLSLTRVCGVAGLGGNPYRSGSYDYYIGEIIRDNDPKGVGPYIMLSLLLDE
jgi:unsaturated rhamnogalacturonyl hydrolase